MENYWYIHIKDDNGAVAEAPGEKTLVDWVEEIRFLKKIPFEYVVNSSEPILQDYLADDLGIPLMSYKLKSVIQQHLTGHEDLQWWEVNIHYQDSEIMYYVPKFEHNLDVLNESKSLFNKSNGELIKANLCYSKAERYAFFPLPELSEDIPFEHRLVVSDKIKKDITRAKLTGIIFSKIPVS